MGVGCVSIPRRYAKNGLVDLDEGDDDEVSIPRRYAKNDDQLVTYYIEDEFQFLVGTLKTMTWWNRGHLSARFQFLVGTLKTLAIPSVVSLLSGFNSS